MIASAPSIAARMSARKFGNSLAVRFQQRTSWPSASRFFAHTLPMIPRPRIAIVMGWGVPGTR
jgi:hypothetical protein